MAVNDFKVTDVPPRVQYEATASQTEFTIPFRFFTDDDVKILLDNSSTPEDSAGYTITGGGTNSTGTLTFDTGLDAGTIATIYRDSRIDRIVNFQSSGDWTAQNVNDQLNRLTTYIQEIALRANDLAITLPVNTLLSGITFPDGGAAANADRAVVWNSAGTGLDLGPTTSEIDTANDSAIAAASSALAAASSADAADTSADAASASATTASGHASTASTQASNAAASASTATTQAAAAVVSAAAAEDAKDAAEALYGDLQAVSDAADAAAASASAASGSASTATTKAGEAATSASTALTAQSAAEDAQSAAEDAQTAAEEAAAIAAVFNDPKIVWQSQTSALLLPNGTTAQRPVPSAGYLRFNSSTAMFEGYDGADWSEIGAGPLLTFAKSALIDVTNADQMGKTHVAFGDGTTRTVESLYGSLGAAQAEYPNAVAGANICQVVIEYAARQELRAFIPAGTYNFNYTAVQSGKTFSLIGEEGTVFKGVKTASEAAIFEFTNCNARIHNIKYDGDFRYSEGVVFSNGNYEEYNCEYVNGGVNTTSVTDFTTFLHLSGTNIKACIYNQKCQDILALGNSGATGGTAPGAARFLLIEPSASASVDVEIHNCEWLAGISNARELDLFNINVNTIVGGVTFYGGKIEHNEYGRRDVKVHSGLVRFYGTRFLQSADFTPAPTFGGVGVQGESGINNIEIIGFAGSAAHVGRIEMYGCYIDYRAAATGFINTGNSTQSSIHADGCTFRGPIVNLNRANPETGASQTGSTIGFRGGLADLGSGVINSRFINGTIPIQLNGKNQYATNNIIDDPVTTAISGNDTVTTGTVRNLLGANTTTVLELASSASNVADFYRGRKILITAGTNAGYYGTVISNATDRTATVFPAASAPFDATSVYSMCGSCLNIDGNTVIHRTAGRLAGAEVIRLQGGLASEYFCTNNKLVRMGGTSAIARFINVASDIYGIVTGNVSNGNATTNVDVSSSFTKVRIFNNDGNKIPSKALTVGTTLNWDVRTAQFATVTLNTAHTLNAPTGLVAGERYTLLITQDGTGGRTITWNSVFKWSGGIAPVLSVAGGAKDLVTFISDGTNLYGQALLNVS